MNYERIYQYRFRGVDQKKRLLTWGILADFMYKKLGKPERILDPAAGLCEFINAVPAKEKWAIDLNDEFLSKHINGDIKKIIGDNLQVEIPKDYFDGVFISNFLEHLHSQEEVALFLERMHSSLRSGGKIAVMGPNFKYTYREYFDFADHTVILSELGAAEHLYAAGFTDLEIIPRFLPLSFRGRLPVNKFLIELYLKLPFAWNILGKQFLLIGTKK